MIVGSKSKSASSARPTLIASLIFFLCLVGLRFLCFGEGDEAPILISVGNEVSTTSSVSEASTTALTTSSSGGGPLVVDAVLAQSLHRTSGDGWTINPEPQNIGNYECKWIDFVSTTGKKAKFCGHSDPDGVTQTIAKHQRFHHCNVLPEMWKRAPKQPNSIYLEIGANIGSCVMEMLLSTDAKIIAFEPHPKNQYVLQRSVAALDQSYRDRFILVPVALGAESGSNTIYAAKGNMGNSVVGKIIKDRKKQEFPTEDQFTIRVERLDSILSSSVDVAFAKLDAQGFECNIVEGMGSALAQRIHQVKFEVSPKFLNAQGCSDLMSRFRNKGYTLYSENMQRKFATEEHTQFGRMMEMVAVRE